MFRVRHAERFNDLREDPALTVKANKSEGLRRYAARCRGYRNLNFTVATAKDTAQPLANLLNIAPQVIPTADPPHEYFQATANAVRRLKDETVLVVGHITIPNIIAEFGGPQLPTICEGVFSDLFLLIPALGRKASQDCDLALRRRFRRAAEICLDCDRIQTTYDEITTDFARHVNSSQWFDIVRFLLLELKEHGNAV